MERGADSQPVSIRDWVKDRGVSLPVSRRNTDAIHRHGYLAEHDAVGDEAPGVVIVDLRRNSSGDSRVLQRFIKAVVEWTRGRQSGGDGAVEVDASKAFGDATDAASGPEEDAPRELYVLIGRNTFSSAVLLPRVRGRT